MSTSDVAWGSARARGVMAATITASGVAFLDATVVNVALRRMGEDLDADFTALQWILDAYLLTLGALVLIGGALGDLVGKKRLFEIGIVAFAVTSLACGLAPNEQLLIVARLLQGVAAALLVPGSLAILSEIFEGEERGRAIGAWSGLSGVFTALGPFVGGVLVDASAGGWRWIFVLNLPLLAGAWWFSRRSIPDLPGSRTAESLLSQIDLVGAALIGIGLGLIIYPLIEWSRLSAGGRSAFLAAGAVLVVAFVVAEAKVPRPMMPLSLWRVRRFSAANVITFGIYAALGGALFLLTYALQVSLGYSALESGAAGIPITVLLLVLSSRIGGLVPRVGGRALLAVGGVVTAAGLMLLRLVEPGATYWTGVFPGMTVFGLGLAFVVAPITTTVLQDIQPDRAGIASGVNNAVARVAGLVAVAVLPLASGLSALDEVEGDALIDGLHIALTISAAGCLVSAVIALVALPGRGDRIASPE